MREGGRGRGREGEREKVREGDGRPGPPPVLACLASHPQQEEAAGAAPARPRWAAASARVRRARSDSSVSLRACLRRSVAAPPGEAGAVGSRGHLCCDTSVGTTGWSRCACGTGGESLAAAGGSTLVGRAENTTTIATACGAGHAGRARARAATFVERKSPVIILCLD